MAVSFIRNVFFQLVISLSPLGPLNRIKGEYLLLCSVVLQCNHCVYRRKRQQRVSQLE